MTKEANQNDAKYTNRLTVAQHVAVLNAIPAHVALLDNEGVIIAVNEAWRNFVAAEGLQSADFFLGQNYLRICDNAHGEDANEAQQVAAGLRKILSGEMKEFGIEYPCHSPNERRWYRLMATPYSEPPAMGAVVMHIDITQRRLAEEALRRSEQQQRELAEKLAKETRRLYESQAVANIGSWETNLTTFEVTWTDETYRIFGANPQEFELTHSDFLNRVHAEDRQMVNAAFEASINGLGSFSIEHRVFMPDGRVKFVEERWKSFTDAKGKPVRAVGTCQDISARKAWELEATRINRALKMLSAVNETLIQAADEIQVLKSVCEIAVADGGYRMAWVGFAQEDAKSAIQALAFAGEESGYLSEINLSWDPNTPDGNGPEGRAIRTGQFQMTEDLENDATFRWRDAASKRGYRSVVCLPLRIGKRTAGLLCLYSATVLQANPTENKLLQELSDNLAFGIGNIRAQRESEQLHRVVTKVATAVSASTGVAFFEQLAESMVEALGAAAGFVAEILPGERTRARTVAAMVDGKKIENFEYPLSETPCAHLEAKDEYVVTDQVAELFPNATNITRVNAKAYVGRRLTNAAGEKIGLIFVLFRQPLTETAFITSTLRILAARATSELERQISDKQLHEQAAFLDAAHDAILVRDFDSRILYWNKGAERLYGWTADEIIGRQASDFLHVDSREVEGALREVLTKGRWEGELQKVGKDGRSILVRASWTLLRDSDGRPKSVLAITSDLTEKKKLEQQFLRAQRMESIGTMAGGIAHDLNNVLAPIMMSVELLQDLCGTDEAQKTLVTLQKSVDRAANLVSQVLNFARGVEGRRIPVDVGHLIRDLIIVMNETFPKHLIIETKPSANLWSVMGDSTQIHQVILNLCVNARDAMPTGGTLMISAESVVLDDTYASMNLNARAGPYVVIKVEDSGGGIPPEVQERIFEPFFTTKETGKGTGLGLSTTAAIVKSHHGFINLYSEVGKGTKFEVYLPADASKEASEEKFIEQTRLPRGKGELILVVDDEENIRSVARSTLEKFGYSVMVAAHGAEAIAIYAQKLNSISVILTDMAMPIMDGPTMIIALKAINPKVRIIGSSGMTANGVVARAVGAGVEHFVPKPYSAEALLKTLRAILDSE